ncbi:MAG: NADH-quinone oxidoreductase subunit NuoE [Elusimicrobiota bacterium]|jgi:NADH-quinone oxidoreductase E subunit|nr:NADH-quinone oxidoreductase subunit NuoE [Elusimicrobiota bacterium]
MNELEQSVSQKKEENQQFDIGKLNPIFDKFKDSGNGSLIPVLQAAQDEYGYLPEAILYKIAQQLEVPISKVYGVVTFYAQFHLQPRGKHIIRACQGTACHVRGGKTILQTLEEELGVKAGHTTDDLKFTLETIACIGACGLAPVMQIDNDTHGRLTADKLKAILEKYQ